MSAQGPDGPSIVVGMMLGAFATVLVADACNADFSKTAERCTNYCSAEHDGGQLEFKPTGYECKCANLQAVKP